MHGKRAEGLSLNMIIIAALGLIVLIIVAVIFRTHIKNYSDGYKRTASKAVESAEGSCEPFFSTAKRKCSVDAPEPTGWGPADEGKCEKEDEKCWVWVGTKTDEERPVDSQNE